MTANGDELIELTDAERAALSDEGDATQEVEAREAEIVETRADPLPLLNARAPDNAGEVLERLSYAEQEIQRQFEDGNITAGEYRDSLRQVAERREEVRWLQHKAELPTEFVKTAYGL